MIDVETLVIATFGVAISLGWLRRRLERNRPGLSIAKAIYVAFGLRLAAIAAVSATGIGTQLRGGDEIGYLAQAHQMAATAWFSGPWTPLFSNTGTNNLHVIAFAIQVKALHFGAGGLRITQVGIAMIGLLLIVAAVYDLAGPKAARLTAWLGAIEPASVFFSGTLLKEPLIELAAGLVIFGATRTWRRMDLTGLVVMGTGCLIGVFDRGYVGFFLIAASLLVLLHVSARNLRRRVQALPLLLGVILVAGLMSPAVVRLTSPGNLQSALQDSQNASTLVTPPPGATVGQPMSNNLALEPVNFSSRANIITNLPLRIRDLLLKPYPWQLGDWSQRFGAIGGLLVFALLIVLIRYAWRSRGSIFRLTGPLLYPTLMMLIAYSLSDGNAGIGFRYRAHLMIPAIGILSILWAASRGAVPARERHPSSIAYGAGAPRPVGMLGSAGSLAGAARTSDG